MSEEGALPASPGAKQPLNGMKQKSFELYKTILIVMIIINRRDV